MGTPTTPLKQYLDQILDKDLKILIPGAGNAYEAQYAYELGFEQVHVLDFSEIPLNQFKVNSPKFPISQLHCQDFFEHEGKYDLILEQTFFCALNPSFRQAYVKKMHSLLKPSGKLVGVMFSKEFEIPGPPFGGWPEDYKGLFQEYFNHVKIEECYNSITPRMGSEVFVSIALPK
ncbi:SAM-dependent methyltransferase [Mongoliitalea lutea]|uniref:SAM-dependent methyltransferase n=1 Tax=Mongoliitalea lutea TaxID=849756 RepID=A0A8J3G6R6_9BACT|nr:SAM-dependent methyltransferase [Mongoliitalea lutea]